MTDEEKAALDAAKKEGNTPPKKPEARKYIWHGIRPTNPDMYNQYGNVKIKPWSMTDEEIDKLLLLHPYLAKLWEIKS